MTNTEPIAIANTRRGFAIAIVRNTRRGRTSYSVVRADRSNLYVTISIHDTEAEARKAANVEWRADMRATA